MNSQPRIETERLSLRPFIPQDAARVRELTGDRRIAEVTVHIPHPYPEGEAERWIGFHPQAWEDGVAAFCVFSDSECSASVRYEYRPASQVPDARRT